MGKTEGTEGKRQFVAEVVAALAGADPVRYGSLLEWPVVYRARGGAEYLCIVRNGQECGVRNVTGDSPLARLAAIYEVLA